MTVRTQQNPANPGSNSVETIHFRSSAVAKILQMPVATLRIWESRYRISGADLTQSGQRRYSQHDIKRLSRIKQLCDLGHAISSLASLNMDQLNQVPSNILESAHPPPELTLPERSLWRIVVIGETFGERLAHQNMQRYLPERIQILAEFDTVESLLSADQQQLEALGPVASLLIFTVGLHQVLLPGLKALVERLKLEQTAVLYGYASADACDAYLQAGIDVFRDPQLNAPLGIWLRALHQKLTQRPGRAVANKPARPALAPANRPTFPVDQSPKFTQNTLLEFANQPSQVTCECPSHLAQLLLQIGQFEAYSAQCQNLSAADAALHAHLKGVAKVARQLFEHSLELVAQHEGLVLQRRQGGKATI